MNFVKGAYDYLVTFPDRWYPFAAEVEGQWVRGHRSYEQAVARSLDVYGAGRLGYKLTLYRETFHFIGSVLFIIAATVLSERLLGSDAALYTLLVAAVAALTFQEFYVHPRRYGQRFKKGVADWLSWVMPMALYVLLFL
jgi:hypothetical protein